MQALVHEQFNAFIYQEQIPSYDFKIGLIAVPFDYQQI